MSEVIAEAGGHRRRGGSPRCPGPNLAAEIARNLPASAVVAAADLELARARRRRGSAAGGSGCT